MKQMKKVEVEPMKSPLASPDIRHSTKRSGNGYLLLLAARGLCDVVAVKRVFVSLLFLHFELVAWGGFVCSVELD